MATNIDTNWRYNLEPQHLTNNPKIFGTDIELLRRMAFESMFSTGISVDFYQCTSDKSDFYNDPDCTWDNAVKIGANFEDNPRIKLLKDLGWYNEDEEIRPQILYLLIFLAL